MKKTVIIILAAFLLHATPAYAAGSACTITYFNPYSMLQKITFACTADDATGAFPDATTKPLRGYIVVAETNPGTTAPTNAYDIVLNTASGVDVMGGALANRDGAAPGSATTQRATPAVSGLVDGVLTLVTTNNSVNSATFQLDVWIYIEP